MQLQWLCTCMDDEVAVQTKQVHLVHCVLNKNNHIKHTERLQEIGNTKLIIGHNYESSMYPGWSYVTTPAGSASSSRYYSAGRSSKAFAQTASQVAYRMTFNSFPVMDAFFFVWLNNRGLFLLLSKCSH